MTDYQEGIKKEVAEIKFLIHDLRVERFINDVIHFHVTLNTDLEIHSVEQAQILHGEDLQELKNKAVALRKAYRDYSSAVMNFSPDRTVLLTGRQYVQTIHDICDLILNPMWGRIDRVVAFLPPDARSVQQRHHYRNGVRWICGVYYRIQDFLAEQEGKDPYDEFDIAQDIRDFTRNVVYGYVTEKSSARVEMRLDQLEPAVVGGNRHRFRRTFFNLVMNAVDAMSHKMVGVLKISTTVENGHVVLRVRDNGSGMLPEKIQQLLTDKQSLDGELRSLGFVFVRQTIADFRGELAIESEVSKGTTVSVRLPYLPDRPAPPPRRSRCEEYNLSPQAEPRHGHGRALLTEDGDDDRPDTRVSDAPGEAAPSDRDAIEPKRYGEIIFNDYQSSEAQFPGCIFAIGVNQQGRVDYFTHRPYERYWNINHEDLSPMLFQATVRGRLEEDDEKTPVLILKAPQDVREYFEFKEVGEQGRSPERYAAMIHDELVRIARMLLETGLSSQIGALVTDVPKFFPESKELLEREPFPLELLARQPLSEEKGG